MAYGFELRNTGGDIVANDTDFNYNLIQEAYNININQYSFQGTTTVYFTNTVEKPLIFIRNNSTQWVGITNLSTTSFSVYAFAPDPTSSEAFRRYRAAGSFSYRVYAPFKYVQGITAGSSTGYGIKIQDATGTVTFNSNYKLPMVTGIGNITIPNITQSFASPTAEFILPSGVSGYPWYDATLLYAETLAANHYNPNLNPQYGAQMWCTRVIDGKFQLSYGYYGVGYTNYPANSVAAAGQQRTILFLNSNVNEPLTGSMTSTNAFTTCTVDINNPTCTTYSYPTVSYQGGNGNPVIYTWSLVNNTGNLSLSPGGYLATVSKTATAGVYTATAQCVLSQNGSTSLTLTHPITLNHTPAPITGSIDYTSGTTSCSYTSGTCTTSETLTMNTSGGDGTTKSYAWSLINNTGSLSINGSTTSTTVVVDKTAAAGTYTATLQCIVSQSGYNYTFTRNLSRTHTQQTSSSGIVNAISITIADEQVDIGALCRMTFNTNGTISYIGNASTGPTNWYSPTTAGIGSSYRIRVDNTSGLIWSSSTPSGVPDDTLVRLTASQGYSWSATAIPSSRSGAGTIKFFTEASGGTVQEGTTGTYFAAATNDSSGGGGGQIP